MSNIIQTRINSAHWYYPDGRPCYEVPKANDEGMRPATLADAKKENLLPSVTTILKSIAKPGLENWKIEQAVLACMTTPRLVDESVDTFIHRVLNIEQQDVLEAKQAADKGSAIHRAIEAALNNQPYDLELTPFVLPVLSSVFAFYGRVIATEKIVVGDGYAGKLDAAFEKDCITIIDFKTCKKIPKESWPDHRLQLAALAKAFGNTGDKPIVTRNIYISTTNPGEIKVCDSTPWQEDYKEGFKFLIKLWQWQNGYIPEPL